MLRNAHQTKSAVEGKIWISNTDRQHCICFTWSYLCNWLL